MTQATPILQVQPLGPLWPTMDPFLFCAHHDDAYPASNGQMGVEAVEFEGRHMGSDFSRRDGFSMYHGEPVPGFPGHPHRGFETVTLVRKGLIDHSDSLGAAARYGGGDVQWLTAGRGIQHAEMFPLLETGQANPLELFQIWLNLPARSKMVEPHFTMFWHERIPRITQHDAQGRETEITVIAGALPATGEQPQARPLAPPPESWAADPGADVAIWTLKLAPGARWTLPRAAGEATQRMLYFFAGAGLRIGGKAVHAHAALQVNAQHDWELFNGGNAPIECLLLQGRPIGEPVVQYGPFVMNSQEQIMQTLQDYRRTQFGGWPWSDQAPVHGAQYRRFARYPGRTEDEEPAFAAARQG
ncbi:pirin family protein [Comamonas composti]|uniref:pirin family protein n=1 Tax=Comamonas composti TaxID=408558 RepID=UPI00047EA969|nr:pirin family protein [Comamonas composti]